MDNRKERLIESGMKLFAEKGYHNTSVQEIVADAGISKGAFYLNFNSKEDFMATSFHYLHLNLAEKVLKIFNKDYLPKESLAKQITVITEYIYEYKNFIIMHLREDISIGKYMEATFTQIRLKNYKWMRSNIKRIYGDTANAYLMDLIILMEGLMNAYFQWIVLDQIKIDKKSLGAFLVARLNDLVEGMISESKPSIIMEDSLIQNEIRMKNQQYFFEQGKIIYKIRELIPKLKKTVAQKKVLVDVTLKIEEELSQDGTDCITLQGLLAHFNGINELEASCQRLAELLNIELLH